MKKFLVLSILLVAAACSQSQKNEANAIGGESLGEKVEVLLDNDQYTDALSLLEAEEESETVLRLKEKTYLNYGLFLEYRNAEVTNMRDKMSGALRQYVEVLKINPDNEKAITEVEQILGIYSSFPDRSPDEEVMAELKKLGF